MKSEEYKAFKNYIHGYLHLSKNDVMNIIKDTLQKLVSDEVSKVFNDKQYLENIVEKELIRQLRYGELKHERRSFVISTMDAIYNRIDSTIHEEVCKRLKIELVEPSNGGENEDNRL